MKRILIFLIALALLLPVLATAETLVDAASKRGISPQRGLPNNPVIPGESIVTGLPVSTEYTPVLVNIDNVMGAWPQWGISKADIIYEMPIHGLSLTRLMALFAYEHPANVGPVRSGRVMHAEMREEWDAGWVYFGIQSKDGSDVSDTFRQYGVRSKAVNLLFDGTGNKSAGLFQKERGYNNPHDHGVKLSEVAALVAGYDFPQRPFLFSDALPTEGDPATAISLVYNKDKGSYTNSSFTYDAATNLYSRYRAGKPYEDRDVPGAPLTFSNVIIQWTVLKFNGAANAPLLTEIGEGNADIFMGGRHIPGYWVREASDARTVFYDQNGQEIRLQRGKTFINITTDRSTAVTYE